MKFPKLQSRIISKDKLGQLRCIINEATDEKPIQAYLAKNRELLSVLAPSAPNIWILDRPKLGSEFIPDFLICYENSTGYNWILVEIESPTKNAQVKNGRQSKNLSEAYGQISDWRIWLRNNISYCRNELGFIGIDAEAKGIIVIGRRSNLNTKYLNQYNELSRGKNIVMTYDRLIDYINCRL